MPDRSTHVLICGASIAGPCLAFWLNRYGFRVTVVERAPALRHGGQNIDIKGAGQQVIARMRLTDAVTAAHTGERGLRFVDADGEVRAEFPRGAETSFTGEMEILRGDLARLLVDATRGDVAYRYGRRVKTVDQGADGVTVTFDDGAREAFDLVVAADGLSSSTRTAIVGAPVPLDYLGVWTSYFRIPKTPSDDAWARWYNAVGGKVVFLRPGRSDFTAAAVNGLRDRPDGLPDAPEDQKAFVRDALRGGGWECDRIADALGADDDFYLGPVSQVKMDRWWFGRAALVGDAAYAPSPLAGIGTTLALVGAYVLAGELATRNDPAEAFSAYERIMRPYVERHQAIPPGVPRLAYPKSAAGIEVLDAAVGVLASRPVQRLIGLLPGSRTQSGDDDFELPDYDSR